jgi:hypothetical protein
MTQSSLLYHYQASDITTKDLSRLILTTRKFMQTLDNKHYVELEILAKKRGITLQQFLRAVVVPEWMDGKLPEKESKSVKTLRRRRIRRRPVPMLTA